MSASIDQKNEGSYKTHLLTANDVEDLLLAVDAFYWKLLDLSRRRTLNLHFDPHVLAEQLFKNSDHKA